MAISVALVCYVFTAAYSQQKIEISQILIGPNRRIQPVIL